MERERPIKWCVGTVQKSSRTRGREGGNQRWTKPQRLRGRFLRSLSSTFSSSSSSDADSGPLNAFSSCNVDVGSQLSVNTRRAGAQASKQPAHPRSSPLPPTPFLPFLPHRLAVEARRGHVRCPHLRELADARHLAGLAYRARRDALLHPLPAICSGRFVLLRLHGISHETRKKNLPNRALPMAARGPITTPRTPNSAGRGKAW